MYVLAALLVAGFFCNLGVRAVDASLFTLAPAAGGQPAGATPVATGPASAPSGWAIVALAWVLVAAPLSWGVYNTISLALQMVR
jgi:hypothetical protein